MNVLVRLATPEDSEKIAEFFNLGLRGNTFSYTGRNKPWDRERIESHRKSLQSGEGFAFVAIDQEKNIAVGECMCFGKTTGRTRHVKGCGWFVHPDYSGQGIATKLLRAIVKEAKLRGIKRLEAEIAVPNKASIKVAEKAGFKIEGRKKKGLLLDNGKYADTIIVGKIL